MSTNNGEYRDHAAGEGSNMAEHDARERPQRDARHRHLALWAATGGTLLLVVALWVMILPTQLSGMRGRTIGTWLNPSDAAEQRPAQSFKDLMASSRQELDDLESLFRAEQAQESTVQAETARLRARIEGANAVNAPPDVNSAPDANTDVNQPSKP